jgi:hypothetical protein|tara:strand:+ start:4923 stop:5387 length:465 start_codon:yes stop_codon:yes gene_type:complete
MNRCSTCRRLKEEDAFYLYKNGKYRQKTCKPCTSKNLADQKRRIYKWVDEYKSAQSCQHCGEKDERCLQLHHKDPTTKKRSVAFLIGKGYIFKTVKSEVEKCEVLCANCHSIHHYEERRSGSWGAGQYTEVEKEEEWSEPLAEQLELFLNFVGG